MLLYFNILPLSFPFWYLNHHISLTVMISHVITCGPGINTPDDSRKCETQ